MNLEIKAKIRWKLQESELFTKGKYSRVHEWELENGHSIPASSSPHIVPLPYSNPEIIDPEEAFLCSLASCHMLFFLSIAAKKKIEVLEYLDSPIATLAKNDSQKLAITEVTLQPQVRMSLALDQEALEHMHHLAHENCFIANSVHSKIQINPVYL